MSAKRETAATVGIGVVACAACCAAPIAGTLTALGLGTLTGTLFFGAAGLAVAVLITAVVFGWRRSKSRGAQRRHSGHACAADTNCCPTEAVVLGPTRTRQ